MTMATFAAATVSTSTSSTRVSLVGPQSERRPSLRIWTSVTTPAASERRRGTSALIVLPGLRRALSVRIYKAADYTAVEDAQTGIFGTGSDLPAAVEDLQLALHDHLAVLTGDETLAPPLQHQLELLRSYFDAS
jgi:hypothetical protein